MFCCWFFFFKQKTAYEMRISDWSSDVCSSDLNWLAGRRSEEYLRFAFAGNRSGNVKGVSDSSDSRGRIGRNGFRQNPAQHGGVLIAPVYLCIECAQLNSSWRLPRPAREKRQIGGASGRERWCQYVSIPWS